MNEPSTGRRNQIFAVDENSANGLLVGTVDAPDLAALGPLGSLQEFLTEPADTRAFDVDRLGGPLIVANATTFNVASVNMSLSDSGNYNTPQTLYGIDDELASLWALDVITVAASGNAFFGFGSAPGVAYPAADPNSLSVGAVYDSDTGGFSYASGAQAFTTGPDRITPFSQRDANLTDIFAPGAPITGAGLNGGLVTMHGTSQASPHIAGVAVLAQQLAGQELDRKLTVSEFTGGPLITTTGSEVPIATTGEILVGSGDVVPLPQADVSGPLINLDSFRADLRFDGIDGSGFAVVVLDTGIDLDHPFFGPDSNQDGVADRIVFHHDFAE